MQITCVKHVTSYNKTTTIVNFADFVGFTMIEHITQVIVFTVYKKNIITSTDFLAKLKSGF